MTSEADILHRVMLAASAAGLTTWRNNTGLAWTGDAERLADGSILIRNPRPLHAGLCKGSADLIGLRPILVTPDMIGAVVAQFIALEVKTARGRLSREQARFLAFVRERGGLALVARSAADLEGLPLPRPP